MSVDQSDEIHGTVMSIEPRTLNFSKKKSISCFKKLEINENLPAVSATL